MKLFKTAKIERRALNLYREIWETNKKVNVYRGEYGDRSVRMTCGRFQLHVVDGELAALCRWRPLLNETDARICKIFAAALACSDFGKRVSDFPYLAQSLTLDGTNEHRF